MNEIKRKLDEIVVGEKYNLNFHIFENEEEGGIFIMCFAKPPITRNAVSFTGNDFSEVIRDVYKYVVGRED